MGEIVNLRTVRKQRAREAAEQAARENRTRHGRTAAQKTNDTRAEQRRLDALDGKRPESDPTRR